jgi:hypothetical protein
MADSWADHVAIRELTSNYAGAASLKDLDGLAAVFTADGRVKGMTAASGETRDLVGPEDLCSYLAKLFEGIEHLTQIPHTSNIVVDGDTASAVCDIVEYVKRPGVPGFTIVVGRYDDKLRRTAQGWRFTERALGFRIFQHVAEAQLGG